MSRIYVLIASAFGFGYAPFAPGTWGTLIGSIILILLWQMGWTDTGWPLMAITAGSCLIGYYSITNLPADWVHDDQRIVIDEVLGLFVAMLFIPLSWQNLFFSFILFRIFDIWKPLGIRNLDNFHSDFSVIVDDLLAGVYANLALRGLMLLLSSYDLW